MIRPSPKGCGQVPTGPPHSCTGCLCRIHPPGPLGAGASLPAWLDSIDDVPWPPHLQALVDRCRDDPAVILASAEAEMAALLEGADAQSFEALRGLLRRQ